MKISLEWLESFFSPSLNKTPEEIAEKLTGAGLEVEGVEITKPLECVLVGEIVELQKHPKADRLTLCQVNVGTNELLPIVCGATNHKKGDKVMTA